MKRQYYEGGIYHIFNRGNNKQPIVYDNDDYSAILNKFFGRTMTTGDRILAYCLMPNHYHLIVRANNYDTIPELMKSFGISYTNYFNKKYNFTGHVFQGVYESRHVDNILYLIYLSKYIHSNPYRSGLIKSIYKLTEYPWSSYKDYLNLGKRDHSWDVNIRPILDLFPNQMNYQIYIEDSSEPSIHKFLNHKILFTYLEEELSKKAEVVGF